MTYGGEAKVPVDEAIDAVHFVAQGIVIVGQDPGQAVRR